ncbi:SAM-dependent methyltransferase [Nonomuraea typhae]|uniref:SAM-dependent methyltransferase n=1 Tax=Nonomuraea typhae TaxID=2603600 RepID=UPI0012FBE309|nr:SAM-dependent methyltransferase [Nonomuraea typhae]
MEREPLQGVEKTALGVAVVRARESRREDRLFDDPYARAFVDAAPGVFPAEPASARDLAAFGPLAHLGELFYLHGVIRTRFFDDHLLSATAAGCRQVVLLAAGLDARAFRLPWPDGVRMFELDLPEVLTFKDTVLTGCAAVPRCERAVVPADLREDWASELAAAGFDRGTPTAWLAEGLLLYLTAEESARLLTGVGELSAPGSELAFELSAPAGRLPFEQGGSGMLAQAWEMPAMRQYAELWKGGLGEDAPGWLSRYGWRPQTHDWATAAASYGRSAAAAPESAGGGFVTAVRGGR